MRNVFLSIFAFLILSALGCDEYNITEPRYYTEDDIFHTYDLDANEPLLISMQMTETCYYELYIISSGGDKIRNLSAQGEGGLTAVTWDYLDDEGNKVGKGIYGFSLNACSFKALFWFELK